MYICPWCSTLKTRVYTNYFTVPFTNIIEWHYERELWFSRPEQPYEESIEPLIDDLIQVAACHKNGKKFEPYQHDDDFEINSPTIPGEIIGQKIKKLRLKKGWSLTQLTKKTGINREYLLNIERGESILCLWALEQILGVLKVKSSAVLDF